MANVTPPAGLVTIGTGFAKWTRTAAMYYVVPPVSGGGAATPRPSVGQLWPRT